MHIFFYSFYFLGGFAGKSNSYKTYGGVAYGYNINATLSLFYHNDAGNVVTANSAGSGTNPNGAPTLNATQVYITFGTRKKEYSFVI